jgi:transcriptional regulator with XRE-family HTH domain
MRQLNHQPEVVSAAREAAGLTQAELGHKVGCKKSLISEIETGSRNCTPRRLYAIADALGVDIADIASSSFMERRTVGEQ